MKIDEEARLCMSPTSNKIIKYYVIYKIFKYNCTLNYIVMPIYISIFMFLVLKRAVEPV